MSSTRDEFLRGLKEVGGTFPTEETQGRKFRFLVRYTHRLVYGNGNLSAVNFSGETSVPVAKVTYKVISSREVKCELLSRNGKVLERVTFRPDSAACDHYVRLEEISESA